MESFEFEKHLVEMENTIQKLKDTEMKNSDAVKQLEEELIQKKQQVYQNLSPEKRMKISRHPSRPGTLDFIRMVFTDFLELHGDRLFSDDPAMIGGLAQIGNHTVMVIGQEKGKDTKEKLFRNFGTAHPEGYRKAMRLMELAARFHIPIITLIDTPGAYPGISAEERGQASAIACNLRDMMQLKVPIIPVIIGEGGSGGALGIGVGDHVLMFEHAYYSVISPEGCSAILWKTPEKTGDAALSLKMTAKDLVGFRIVDGVLEEPLGGAHHDPQMMADILQKTLLQTLEVFKDVSEEELLRMRHEKFRKIGVYYNGSGNASGLFDSAKDS